MTFRQAESSFKSSIEQQRFPVSTFARWFRLTFSSTQRCSCVIPRFSACHEYAVRIPWHQISLSFSFFCTQYAKEPKLCSEPRPEFAPKMRYSSLKKALKKSLIYAVSILCIPSVCLFSMTQWKYLQNLFVYDSKIGVDCHDAVTADIHQILKGNNRFCNLQGAEHRCSPPARSG